MTFLSLLNTLEKPKSLSKLRDCCKNLDFITIQVQNPKGYVVKNGGSYQTTQSKPSYIHSYNEILQEQYIYLGFKQYT